MLNHIDTEAIGDIDNNMDVVEDWIEKFYKGVIY
jgi:hypothetical protein